MKSSKNSIIAICTVLAVAIFIGSMTFMHINATNKENQQRYIYENTSTDAIVINKSHYTYRGTHFVVTAQHQSITASGEETTIMMEYTVPYEDYEKMEIGDTIITEYNPDYPTVGQWRYVSFIKAEDIRYR